MGGFAALGLWKVRLTGGEPTLRGEFLDIAKTVSGIEGIRQIAITTNGYRLEARAQDYADHGISAINISMDSLKPEKFHAITGHDRLAEILRGIDACKAAGIATIKLNSVLLKGLNDDELDDFIAFVQRGLPRFERTMHFIGNVLVEVDGDTARAESYVIAHHRLGASSTKPERDFDVGLRYVDDFERRDGAAWRSA